MFANNFWKMWSVTAEDSIGDSHSFAYHKKALVVLLNLFPVFRCGYFVLHLLAIEMTSIGMAKMIDNLGIGLYSFGSGCFYACLLISFGLYSKPIRGLSEQTSANLAFAGGILILLGQFLMFLLTVAYRFQSDNLQWKIDFFQYVFHFLLCVLLVILYGVWFMQHRLKYVELRLARTIKGAPIQKSNVYETKMKQDAQDADVSSEKIPLMSTEVIGAINCETTTSSDVDPQNAAEVKVVQEWNILTYPYVICIFCCVCPHCCYSEKVSELPVDYRTAKSLSVVFCCVTVCLIFKMGLNATRCILILLDAVDPTYSVLNHHLIFLDIFVYIECGPFGHGSNDFLGYLEFVQLFHSCFPQKC